MPYKKYEMPKYPCIADMWDRLKGEARPIVVYGMGNGADKLIERFNAYGIEIADFFASDEFVRGHFFHGKRVKSFSEIKETYRDFVIVLSFASNREEVLDKILDLSEKYDMYIPDMPIDGIDEYFDRDFFNKNYEELIIAQNALCDENSKNLFSAIINYKLSGKAEYLFGAFSTKDELYSLIPCRRISSYADIGAYRGDTIAEALKYFPNLKSVTAIEPDAKNFKRLAAYTETVDGISFDLINAAAWSIDGGGMLSESGNRNSTVTATASYQHKEKITQLIKIDTAISEKADYIKYDVEGAELEALIGSDETVKKYAPIMLVSLYHRSRDIFSLINMLKNKYQNYDFYLRRLLCVPAWEINLIMLPKTGDKNEKT